MKIGTRTPFFHYQSQYTMSRNTVVLTRLYCLYYLSVLNEWKTCQINQRELNLIISFRKAVLVNWLFYLNSYIYITVIKPGSLKIQQFSKKEQTKIKFTVLLITCATKQLLLTFICLFLKFKSRFQIIILFVDLR